MTIESVETDGKGSMWSSVYDDEGVLIAQFYTSNHRQLAEQYLHLNGFGFGLNQ